MAYSKFSRETCSEPEIYNLNIYVPCKRSRILNDNTDLGVLVACGV